MTNCEKGHLLIKSSDGEVEDLPTTPNPYAVSGKAMQEVIPATIVKAPVKAGWICLILGYVFSGLGSIPIMRVLLPVALGFGLAALVLGIICLVRKRTIQGCIMIVLNPLIYHIIVLLIGALWIFQVMQEPEKKVDFVPPRGSSEHTEHPVR